jgi:outer membrane protein TolC
MALKLHLLITGLLTVSVTICLAQNAPAARKISPDSVFDIRQRLVELALPGPAMEMANRNEAIAHQMLRKSKGQILNQVVLSGNLNEFTIQGAPTNTANLYPRYNIGVVLPVGTFFTRGKDIRIAEENISIASADKARIYEELKATVLKHYEDYVMYSVLLDVHSRNASTEYLSFLKVESEFEAGSATEEAYNEALKKYNEELVKKINAQRNKEIARIEIEKYILVPLNDVLKGLK